ncbi:hypothetical protein BTN33_08605 [Aeromonas veronii]|nr:hypothetical protein BTN33_08605 [Aeromonas veronii]
MGKLIPIGVRAYSGQLQLIASTYRQLLEHGSKAFLQPAKLTQHGGSDLLSGWQNQLNSCICFTLVIRDNILRKEGKLVAPDADIAIINSPLGQLDDERSGVRLSCEYHACASETIASPSGKRS